VGHQHKTNHGTPRGCVPGAPHERVLILTIRSPSARAIFSKFGGLLHCSKTSPIGAQFRRREVLAGAKRENPIGDESTVVMVNQFPTGQAGAVRTSQIQALRGDLMRARTAGKGAVSAATASRGSEIPAIAVVRFSASGRRSASSAARSTTNPSTAIGS
jgi:hypothetical protein